MAKAGENRKLDLSKLEEIHNDAYESSRIFKVRMKAYHDKHIVKKSFELGQRVWVYSSPLHLFSGKLKSRWEGPAIVQRVHLSGAIKVRLGKHHFTVNGQRLKPYINGDIGPAPEESLEFIDVDSVVES
ncbi:unnamed protein product [Victoria cruziana]